LVSELIENHEMDQNLDDSANSASKDS